MADKRKNYRKGMSLEIDRCRLRAPFSVDACRYDSAGISGTLATGEETFHPDVLQRLSVSYDSDGSRSACLYADHDGFVRQEAAALPPELLEAFPQPFGQERGHPEMEGRGEKSRRVRAFGKAVAQFLVGEVHHALRGSSLTHVALLPAGELEGFLEIEHPQGRRIGIEGRRAGQQGTCFME